LLLNQEESDMLSEQNAKQQNEEWTQFFGVQISLLERSAHRWEHSIKTYLYIIRCEIVGWNQLARDAIA
jgi:hypothetical protein